VEKTKAGIPHADPDLFPEWIFAGKLLPGQFFVDDHDGLRIVRVRINHGPTGSQRDAHRLKVTR
jgi:hypothetical protein